MQICDGKEELSYFFSLAFSCVYIVAGGGVYGRPGVGLEFTWAWSNAAFWNWLKLGWALDKRCPVWFDRWYGTICQTMQDTFSRIFFDCCKKQAAYTIGSTVVQRGSCKRMGITTKDSSHAWMKLARLTHESSPRLATTCNRCRRAINAVEWLTRAQDASRRFASENGVWLESSNDGTILYTEHYLLRLTSTASQRSLRIW